MEKLISLIESNKEKYLELHTELSAYYPFSINTIQKFKEKYSDDPIQEIINQITLQKRATQKFPNPQQWLFTDKALQQSSCYELAKYHGSLFKNFDIVADICCGIGSDLLYLSKDKSKCYAIDSDPNTLNITKQNMRSFNAKNIVYQNIKAEDFEEDCQAIYIDPDRRPITKRTTKIDEISPPFTAIQELINNYENIAVKLSPMLDYENDIYKKHSIDFVSIHGELKECLLRTGSLKHVKQAVIINNSDTHTLKEATHHETPISPISNWLLEPDPAIIRSHLINELAHELNMNRIDPNIALLTQHTPITPTAYGNIYKVTDVFDYNLKTLNLYLKSHQIGIIDIKTKGFSEPVEHFRKKLTLKGKNKTTIFIIRIGEKHVCVVS